MDFLTSRPAMVGERADHLEGEEAGDVHGVVAGLDVEHGGEVEKLLEAGAGGGREWRAARTFTIC